MLIRIGSTAYFDQLHRSRRGKMTATFMSISAIFVHFIHSAVGSTTLTGIAIVTATFVLEDPTTVLVGVLSAGNVVSVPTALISLYLGIVLRVLALHGLGSLARTHPRLAQYVEHERVIPVKSWFEKRYALTIFSVRFIPGLRLPTYTASGFFRMPFGTFLATAIGATLVWATVLFSASFWFGNLTSEWVGWTRWAIAGVFLLILFFVGRHNMLSFRTHEEEAPDDAEH